MHRRQMWRYYCDFCKKAGMSSFHMRNHERHCTANPERVCRMHKHVAAPQAAMTTMISAARFGIDELREAASGCPACMLAALRLGKMLGVNPEDGTPRGPAFDYKAELTQFWREQNEEVAHDYE